MALSVFDKKMDGLSAFYLSLTQRSAYHRDAHHDVVGRGVETSTTRAGSTLVDRVADAYVQTTG